MTKFREGDIVDIRAVVGENCTPDEDGDISVCIAGDSCWMPEVALTLVERPIKVGDRVASEVNGNLGTVRAISDDPEGTCYWVRLDGGYYTTWNRHNFEVVS